MEKRNPTIQQPCQIDAICDRYDGTITYCTGKARNALSYLDMASVVRADSG